MKTPSSYGNISTAFINTYGKETIKNVFDKYPAKRYEIFKALLQRDAPNLYKALGWRSSMGNVFNAVVRKVYA